MEQLDEKWLGQALSVLAGAYPSERNTTPEQFRVRVRSYLEALRPCGKQAIQHAVTKAPKEYPDFFPTAGQLLNLAYAKQREAKADAEWEKLKAIGDGGHQTTTEATEARRSFLATMRTSGLMDQEPATWGHRGPK